MTRANLFALRLQRLPQDPVTIPGTHLKSDVYDLAAHFVRVTNLAADRQLGFVAEMSLVPMAELSLPEGIEVVLR